MTADLKSVEEKVKIIHPGFIPLLQAMHLTKNNYVTK